MLRLGGNEFNARARVERADVVRYAAALGHKRGQLPAPVLVPCRYASSGAFSTGNLMNQLSSTNTLERDYDY